MSKSSTLVAAVDRATLDRVVALTRKNNSTRSFEARRLIEAGLRIDDLVAYAESQAAAYGAAATGKQVRAVPERQLNKLKAAHWRILADVARNGVTK